jgi:hypothetical protein
MVHACNSSYVEGRGRRISVSDPPQAKMEDPIWKMNNARRAGGVTEVVRLFAT